MKDKFTVRFEKEDGEWVAFYVESPNISAYGDTPLEAFHELGIAARAMEENYRKRGEPIPWRVSDEK